MEMGDKIKDLRLQKGMTLEQLGNIVGVGKSTVRKWETGIIKDMRRDKIAKLASALGTTPSYLMGWDEKSDRWNLNFRSNLSKRLNSMNKTDASDCGIDIDRLQLIADGHFTLSLSEACSIADSLGESVDELVGMDEKSPLQQSQSGPDALTLEIVSLLQTLPESKKQAAMEYMRFLVMHADS